MIANKGRCGGGRSADGLRAQTPSISAKHTALINLRCMLAAMQETVLLSGLFSGLQVHGMQAAPVMRHCRGACVSVNLQHRGIYTLATKQGRYLWQEGRKHADREPHGGGEDLVKK